MGVEFDPAKDDANKAKHGLSLAQAVHFDFDTAVVTEDADEAYGEQRFVAIGSLRDAGIVATIAYTYRGESVRVISLRRATPKESRRWPAR